MKKVLLTIVAISATGSLFCSAVINDQGAKQPVRVVYFKANREAVERILQPGQSIELEGYAPEVATVAIANPSGERLLLSTINLRQGTLILA